MVDIFHCSVSFYRPMISQFIITEIGRLLNNENNCFVTYSPSGDYLCNVLAAFCFGLELKVC